MSQSCHCEAPQGPWQSRRTVLNFRKISANSKHFTGDSHVASLLGMTKRRLFAIPRIPRCFPLVFPPKPSAGLVFRHPDAKTKCTARQAGRSACRKVPSGLLPSCLQNCKTYFVVLFCNFAAAAGYLTRKDTLTVPGLSNVPVLSLRGPAGAVAISQDCSEFQENLGEFETFYRRFPRRFAPRNDKAEALCHTEDTPMFSPCLPSETFGWTGFSTPRRKNEMYRPASRTVSLSKSPFGSFAKLPSKLQNVFCSSVLQFCRCGGLFDAKGHPDGFLSHFSSLRNLRLGSFFASPFRKNEMYRPASRTVHFVEKKERERKKRKSMKKRGGAIYGRHRIRAGDCPARTAPAHWPMLLALRSAPHRPCCQTRWAGGTSCRSARW